MDLNDCSEREQLEFSLGKNIDVSNIGDLFDIVKNQTSVRTLSALVCLLLTYFVVTWRKVDIFLKQLGALNMQLFVMSPDLISYIGVKLSPSTIHVIIPLHAVTAFQCQIKQGSRQVNYLRWYRFHYRKN